MAWLDLASRSLLVDYSGLRVHRPLLERVAGQAGYRLVLLLFSAVFFMRVALLPYLEA